MLSTAYDLLYRRTMLADAALMDATLYLKDLATAKVGDEETATAATAQRNNLLDPVYGIGPHSHIEDLFNTVIDQVLDGSVPRHAILSLWNYLNTARVTMRLNLDRKRERAKQGTFDNEASQLLAQPMPMMDMVQPPAV